MKSCGASRITGRSYQLTSSSFRGTPSPHQLKILLDHEKARLIFKLSQAFSGRILKPGLDL
jgi:hypothetical protein